MTRKYYSFIHFAFLLKKICYLNRHILLWTGIMFYYNLTFKHFINCTQFPIQVSNAMRGIGNSNIVQFRLYRKYIWINRNLKCNKFDEQNDKQKGNDARNTMMHVFVSRSVESELQQRQWMHRKIIADNLTLIGINSCVKWSFIKRTEANHLPYFISRSTFNNDTKRYKTQQAK